MGNSYFWYMPAGDLVVTRAVDLTRKITTRSGPTYFMDQTIETGITGLVNTNHLSGRARIEISLKFDLAATASAASRALRRELYALVNHLQHGGWVSFAEDVDYAYAAATLVPVFGPTVVVETTNIFPVTSPTLTNREVYLQTDPGLAISEMGYVATDNHTTGNIVLADSPIFSYASALYTFIREAGSYPALRLIPDRRNDEILITDNEYVWEFRAVLEEDPGQLAVFGGFGLTMPENGDPGPQTDTPGGPGEPGPTDGIEQQGGIGDQIGGYTQGGPGPGWTL